MQKIWLTFLCVLMIASMIAGTIASRPHTWRGWETISRLTMAVVLVNMTVAAAILVWNT